MTDLQDVKEGRWLVASNTSMGAINFRHPEKDAADVDHLRLGSFESKVIDPLWLNVPWFVDAMQDGRVVVVRSDELPDNTISASAVVEDMITRGWDRNAALTAYHICGCDPIPPELDQYIDLEPSQRSRRRMGPTYINQRWDLLKQHLPFLRELLALEQRWRNRRGVVRRLEKRIKELEDVKT
ncbi:MAG: hypothetical protein WC977_15230 [Anaerovoracaceae bacterium]|jgi:hypothetical protein